MRILKIFILLSLIISACQKESTTIIDLAGQWRFQIDSLDIGTTERWYSHDLSDMVQLPGSMTTNYKGSDISISTKWTGSIFDSSWYFDEKYAIYREQGNIKIPFWLQPGKYYTGAAWYQKKIEIPQDWEGQFIELFLERCHWETQVWVDDQKVGMQNSLATPHIYNLSEYLSPGTHTLTILVDNRIKDIDPGVNSHSIADHTQTNWNGIIGKMELRRKPEIHVEDIRIYPDVVQGKVIVHGKIMNFSDEEGIGKLNISTKLNNPGADPPKIHIDEELEVSMNGADFSFEFSLGDELGIWDETYPNLYTLNILLETKGNLDEQNINFGMRDFRTDSTWFTINGRPIFLRGTLECAIFPKTGYPATDVEEWERIIKVAKSHGLNHIRFHSWCPPEAAFVAADELGFYLQVECSSWANQSTTLGDGLPIDQFIYDESERIVKTFGNHPSFCLMAYGNEPGGGNHMNFLAEFVSYWKEKDNRRVYTGGAGWPVLMENEYHNIPQPRIQAWGEQLNSIINAEPPQTSFDWAERIKDLSIPVVSHEIGQWCVYPNFREIEKYDGVLKPKNFEIFQESLREKGLEHLADSFLLASGKLQTLCYKADIEAALRTPGFAGFQLLDLHDFPGQGTALVGVLDPFWEEKGYVSPEEYREFCNSTVPLARMEKRVFYNDEFFTARIEVAHFGDEELPYSVPFWQIRDRSNPVLFQGTFDTLHIPIGNCIPLGDLKIDLDEISQPSLLRLTVKINEFENGWDFWVYPKKNESVNDILVTRLLDHKAITYLEKGGSVLWSIPESTKSENLNDGIGFSSIFWNTAWTNGQKPHSLGILCNPDHPAFNEFPTEYHSNWQWWDAMTYSNAIILDDFPMDIQPIVRVIDDWVTNRSQALLLEVKVGNGKLLISGIDFFEIISQRPAGKQLLHSLKSYMAGNEFRPGTEMSVDQIQRIF